MVEGRGRPGFAAESFERGRVLRHAIGQKFKGDESAQRQVFGFVDHAHAAATKFFDDAVVRNGLADHSAEILGPSCVQVKDRCGLAGLSVVSARGKHQLTGTGCRWCYGDISTVVGQPPSVGRASFEGFLNCSHKPDQRTNPPAVEEVRNRI
jgi:hypothetical protein